MECNNDVKNNLKFENINFKVLTQVYMWDNESEVETIDLQQDAVV
jgi:hypothetical protein